MSGERSDLQERLFAEGRTGGHRRFLVVLQGVDTSGEGGTLGMRRGCSTPGVRIKSFQALTAAERRHDFLWWVEKALRGRG